MIQHFLIYNNEDYYIKPIQRLWTLIIFINIIADQINVQYVLYLRPVAFPHPVAIYGS